MKFDKSKVNKARVGDLVYGRNTLEELKVAIEMEKECDINKDIVLRMICNTPNKPYLIEDLEEENSIRYEYVYSVSDIAETKFERFARIFEMSKNSFYDTFRHEICEVFFKLKKKGLILEPMTDEESILVNYSYDLDSYDDCDRFMTQIEDCPLRDVQYVFSVLSANDRFAFHETDSQLKSIPRYDDMYLAMCNLIARALDSLV